MVARYMPRHSLLTLASLFSLLQLSACSSTPEVQPRMARFDSPEVHSKPFKFKIAVGTDTSNDIPMLESERASEGSSSRVSAAMTLGYGVEIKYTDNGDDKFGIKYQLLGAPLEEKVAGNFSLAASLGYIHSSRSESYPYLIETPDDQDELVERSWKLKHDTYDAALIGGYRLHKQVLLYGSVFYQEGDIKGKIYLTPRSVYSYEECTPSTNCSIEQFGGSGKSYGANLGLEYEILPWLVIAAEAVHHKAKWFKRSNDESAVNVGVEFRF